MQTSHRGAATAHWTETAELETEVSEKGTRYGRRFIHPINLPLLQRPVNLSGPAPLPSNHSLFSR